MEEVINRRNPFLNAVEYSVVIDPKEVEKLILIGENKFNDFLELLGYQFKISKDAENSLIVKSGKFLTFEDCEHIRDLIKNFT